MNPLKVLLLPVIAQSSVALARPVLLPAKLHGEFNAAIKFCGTGLSDKRLRISANKIRYYESEGIPKSILLQKNGDITVLIEVTEFTGDETIWHRMDQFSLSPDGQSLTVKMAEDDQSGQINEVLVRCPRK